MADPSEISLPKATEREPGIYEDVPFDDYLSWPFVSQSRLKPMQKSPLHYREAEDAETDAKSYGRFAHAVLLEPETLLQRFTVMPDYCPQVLAEWGEWAETATAAQVKRKPKPVKPRATGRYAELCAAFIQSLDGREVQIVPQEDLDAVTASRARLTENERVAKWLALPHKTEVSIVWDDPDTGLRCKGRIDLWLHKHNLLLDYKTTSRLFGFEKEIVRWGYHVQAAFYIDGLSTLINADAKFETALAFGIIAQESKSPHWPFAAPVDADSIESGRILYRASLARLAACQASGEWPGPDNPEVWRISDYDMPEPEVDFSGLEAPEQKAGDFEPGDPCAF